MPVADRMVTADELAAIQILLSEKQSGGHSGSQVIDREWLLQDDNIEGYMLYYFPNRFWEWEPVNDLFFNFVENTAKGVVLMPAQHGKTTMMQRWMIRAMCKEPNISIGYTEKNEPTAYKRGLAILQELSKNLRLINHYGRFKPTDSLYPWAMGAFTINQRTMIGDSPTFSAFGAGGGSILGWRFNILWNDDPVTAENSQSEQERGNLLQWFNAAAKTCPTPLPIAYLRYLLKHMLVGTPFRMDDLYHSVICPGSQYELLHLQAVLDEFTGETLSRRYAYRDPDVLREMAKTDSIYARLMESIDNGYVTNLYAFKYGTDGGTLAYYQRYQCQPLDPDAQEWKDVYFTGDEDEGFPGCFDRERSYGDFNPDWTIVTALDPQSGSTSKYSARAGLVTLAADPANPKVWYLIDLDFGKWKQQSSDPNSRTQMSALVEALDTYDSLGVIESNAAQAGLVDAARLEAGRRGKNIRVRPHHTGNNKNDTEVGLRSLLPMFERGAVRMPYKTESDRKKSQELANEFTMMGVYPYNDLVMAFWMAAYNLRKRVSARKRSFVERELPEYVNRQQDIIFPKWMTAAQKRAYLGEGDPDDLEEEAV